MGVVMGKWLQRSGDWNERIMRQDGIVAYGRGQQTRTDSFMRKGGFCCLAFWDGWADGWGDGEQHVGYWQPGVGDGAYLGQLGSC